MKNLKIVLASLIVVSSLYADGILNDTQKSILDKKQTAQFIATKVYRYFVNEKINPTHVQEIADTFYQSPLITQLASKTLSL